MPTADFAGACDAVVAKFKAEWLTDDQPRTRVAEVNKEPDAPWPPRNDAGQLQPWVLISVEGAGAAHPGFGTPGRQVYVYDGLIYLHVFVPVGAGVPDARALAVAAGEIFRSKKFYDNVTPGCYVRTWTPRVDGGGPGDDENGSYRVSATIPFEYFHLG